MLADEFRRLAFDPPGGSGTQASGPLAELVTTAEQGLFEDQAVLGLGAAAVGGVAFLKRQDEGFGNVSDQELRHGGTISHIMLGKCDQRPILRGGVAENKRNNRNKRNIRNESRTPEAGILIPLPGRYCLPVPVKTRSHSLSEPVAPGRPPYLITFSKRKASPSPGRSSGPGRCASG